MGYRVEKGTLFVEQDLSLRFDPGFETACQELLRSPQEDLTIDLSRIRYINSTYLGIIGATFFDAQAAGKRLRILVREEVALIFRTAGMTDLMDIMVAAS